MYIIICKRRGVKPDGRFSATVQIIQSRGVILKPLLSVDHKKETLEVIRRSKRVLIFLETRNRWREFKEFPLESFLQRRIPLEIKNINALQGDL